MKKNVGELDSFLRISGGLFMLGLAINRDSPIMMAFGAAKVAEGITKFCPMLYFMGLKTNKGQIEPMSIMNNTKEEGTSESY